MNNKKLVILISLFILIPIFSGCLEEEGVVNSKPFIEIESPSNNDKVTGIVTISGKASDPDDDGTLKKVEVYLQGKWHEADGTNLWKYEWNTFDLTEGVYTISARSWDGADYSDVEKIKVQVFHPDIDESDSHKWAVFIMAANFPIENESKLGYGGLVLAEEIAAYLIEKKGYSTSNIAILFDDGWLRADDGYGEILHPIEKRYHRYDVSYEGATKENVVATLKNVIKEANKFDDSEVFIWLAGHGYGDSDNTVTGDNLFEKSAVFLWDAVPLEDRELGNILSDLDADKTCVIVDACFSGGFAERTIYDFPTFFLLRSGIPKPGRVVLTGSSKFRVGYASTTEGPLFSILWFNGLKSRDADGFKSGIRERGRPTRLRFFKDGMVSVEEAFYYAKYILRTDPTLDEYSGSLPQINDQYPRRGFFGSMKGLILGQ